MAEQITLIGAGRMGSALASGWLKASPQPELTIVDPNPSDEVRFWRGISGVSLNSQPKPAGVLVVAVKPQVFAKLAADIREWIGPETLVVSIMAAISLNTLQEQLQTERVVRAMPNTPGAVGEGVTLLSVPYVLGDKETERARDVLFPLGMVEGPMEEDTLIKATAVSGCGPAYGFLLVEAMTQAGIAAGLTAELSERIARQTVIGAGALMAASEDSASSLREGVTSPGGVTAAALSVLMRSDGLPSLMEEAVQAAIDRDQALSRESG